MQTRLMHACSAAPAEGHHLEPSCQDYKMKRRFEGPFLRFISVNSLVVSRVLHFMHVQLSILLCCECKVSVGAATFV